MKIIILKGLPASGKTTWAKEYVLANPNTKRINKDDLRSMLDAGKWSKNNEKFILDLRDDLIIKCLLDRLDIIVDDTNFNPKHEDRIRGIAENYKIEVETKFFDTPLQECISRDAKRPNPVGEKVIYEIWEKYLKPKPIKPKPELPFVIICDIDGTIALHNDNRGHFEYNKVDTDQPRKEIINIVSKYPTILVSGREDSCREKTEIWLKEHSVDYLSLYMRKSGDRREDSIVKEEIYNEFIKDKCNVLFVLDDRNRVVDMWRSKGLTCLQVDYGNF